MICQVTLCILPSYAISCSFDLSVCLVNGESSHSRKKPLLPTVIVLLPVHPVLIIQLLSMVSLEKRVKNSYNALLKYTLDIDSMLF